MLLTSDPDFRGMGHDPIYNLNQDNIRNLMRIISDARSVAAASKIAFLGSSTVAGHGSSGGPFYISRLKSWPYRFADQLSTRGVPVNTNNAFGCSNIGTILGTSSQTMQLFDPRITFGTGWSIHAQYTAGGRFFTAPSGTTAALAFDFGSFSWDTVDIWYFRNAGNGTFAVDRGGSGPSSGSPVSTSGTNTLQKATLSWASAASGVLNLSTVTVGTVYIMGVAVRNSTVPNVEVYNLGIGGSNSADWQRNSAVYDPKNVVAALAPDVTFIDHGPNDWNTGTSTFGFTAPTDLATYQTNIQAAITTAQSTGDAILVFDMQSDPSGFATKATQLTYQAVLKSLADSNNVPLINLQTLFGDYSVANTRGYMADQRHGSIRGYDVVGRLVDRALMMAGG